MPPEVNETIDICDLVYTSSLSKKTDRNVGNCDINNDLKIDGTDMEYLRAYLINGAWK